MANIPKPDLSLIWSSSGDILKPSDSKIQQGWAVEIPPRQWFNWWQNKTDNAIGHLNQHGIAIWDNKTEYQANMSYTQGTDGVIYKATATNTNSNPVGDTSGNWVKAFVDGSQVPTASNNSIRFPGGIVMQWVSNTGIVQSGIGSTTNIGVTFPVPLSQVLSYQLTHGLGNAAESAEMAYSVDSITNTSAVAKFARIRGENTTGNETVRANFFVIGIAAN